MNEELDKILKENEELKKENALLKEKLKSLQINLEFDSLTGVYNKKTFKDLVTNYNDLGVLVIIDINNFKSINDTYGHLLGDEILKSLGNVLNKAVRKSDFVGRFGGDEFLIFFKGINLSKANIIMERLNKNVNKINIQDDYYLSISYGLTEYDNAISYNDNLKVADNYLYMNKKRTDLK
ncbi:MAG: GGDEF domain-containing protein [Firmicutes bacterium]|nr:GGDEF domain-containing protein [Bacillota bacterium]